MKRVFRKLLSGFMCLAFTLFSFVAMGNLVGGQNVYADPEQNPPQNQDPGVTKSFSLGISYEGENEPNNYNVSYTLYSGDSPASDQYQSNGVANKGEGVKSFSVTVPTDHTGYKVKITVQSAGKDIYFGGAIDSDWENGKLIDVDSLAATYSFVLKDQVNNNPNQGQGDPNQGQGDPNQGQPQGGNSSLFELRIEEGPEAAGKYTLQVATSTDGSTFSSFQATSDNPYESGEDVIAIKFKITKSGSANIMLQSQIDPTGGLVVGQEYTLTNSGHYMVQVDRPWNTITWGGREGGTDFSAVNGTVTLTKVTVNGTAQDLNALTIPNDSPFLFENGRNMAIKLGGNQSDLFISEAQTGTIQATFTFTPNYGYQVSDVTTNGGSALTSFMPGTAVSSFTLNCNDLNIHFGVKFSRVSDTVTVGNNSTVTAGSIGNGGNAISSGSLAMSVNSGTAAASMTTSATASDASAELVGAVDISLKQQVSKGGDRGYWENSLTDLAGNVNVSLALADPDPTSSYSVVRNHGGSLTYIEAIYNNGSITFPTNGFSTYAIYKTDKRANDVVASASGSSSSSSDSGNSEVANAPIITPDGKVIESWDDVKTDIETNASSYKDEPVQIVINKSTELPKSVFESITHTKATGLHAFVGGGSAITFLNNNKLKNQEAVDLSCTVSEVGTRKTIKFNSRDKLKASVILHSVVPVGTNIVYIYMIDADGTKRVVGSTIPTAEGRFCFAISQLGQYEIDY